MPIARHTFSHLDTDTDKSALPSNAFDSALNLHLEPGYVAGASGNVPVPYELPPTGTNVRLGGFEDGSTGTAVSLLYNSEGAHRLVRYDPLGNAGAGSETTVLEWAGLNLSADLTVQGSILDGLLLYLDAGGIVRSVNLSRAVRGEYTAALLLADPYALHLVKRPPVAVPAATRQTNGDATDPRSALNLTHGTGWQFAYRYRYADGDVTPLGTYSPVLAGLPTTGVGAGGVLLPPTNFIRLDAPALPPLVEVAELCVRQDDGPTWAVAQEVRRPDAGTPAPAFVDFYGRTTGTVLTTAEATKIAEALPVRVAALALSRSRVMVGGCTEGYAETPVVFTAQAQAAADGATGTAAGPVPTQLWRSVQTTTYFDGRTEAFTRFAVLAGTIVYPDPASVYDLVEYDPATRTYGNAQGRQIAYFRLFTNFDLDGLDTVSVVTDLGVQPVRTQAGGPATGVGGLAPVVTFKARAVYRVGLQYYDAQGTPGGVLAAMPVAIPALDYRDAGNGGSDPLTGARPVGTAIHWALGAGVIPPWAETYTVCISANQAVSTFLQFQATAVAGFAGRDSAGKPILTALTATRNVSGKLWVDIGGIAAGVSSLGTAKFGYVWAAGSGDQLRFVDANVSVQITGQFGEYVEVNYSGPKPADSPRIEIFTPVALEQLAAFYERSPRYRVLRPATGPRHEATAGTLTGDVALVQREGYTKNVNTYLDNGAYLWHEAMNVRNEQAGVWLDVRRGRPAFAVPGGSKQVQRAALVRFSGVKVQGTLLNGLGQWDALSQYDELPQEQGAVTRLTVADQTTTDGTILLVNQERGDVSLSLGQGQIRTADDQPLLVITKAVIGGSNALRGGYGCTDPAGVVAYAGQVFFPCRRRAELLRYGRNGLTPLALTYKARVRLEAAFRRYARARISGCFDPRRKEYLLTFHATTTLPGLTLVYSDRYEAWADALSAVPEAGLGAGHELLTWKDGALWRHTARAPQATFYGKYTAPQLTFTVAQPAGVSKQFKDIAVESASLWLATGLTTDTGLHSRTLAAWFTKREGVHRAGLRRAVRPELPVLVERWPDVPLLPRALVAALPVGTLPAGSFPAAGGAGPSVAGGADPTVTEVTASALVVGGRLVARLGGRVVPYDALNPAHVGALLGLALNTANATQVVRVRLSGLATVVGLGLTADADYFAGPNGVLVRDPVGLAFAQLIGRAAGPDQLLYDPQDLFIL